MPDEIIVMTGSDFETAAYAASDLGAEHGKAAASWFFDGNTTAETYAAVLRGLDEGDPAIMDQLPHSPLSGEYADSMTPAKLLRELGWNEESVSAAQQDDLCLLYEQAFGEASQHEIERVARQQAFGDDN